MGGLIGISKSAHSRHHSEDVVVEGIDVELSSGDTSSESQAHCSIIDTGHVDTATWLMLFGIQSERVHVDTSGGSVGKVLIRLNKVEVTSRASREPIVSIELELEGGQRFTSLVGVGKSCTRSSEIGPSVSTIVNI